MRTNISRHTFVSALTVIFLFTLATIRGQDTIYVWSSIDGNPGGISGTIVLNSPSYSGAFDASRIVSVTLSSTVTGIYNVTLPTDIYGWGFTMRWDPTGISEMLLGFSTGQPSQSWLLIADQDNIFRLNPWFPADISEYCGGSLIASDYSGAWVAHVPEPASKWLCVFTIILGSLCRFRRIGSKWLRP
jgi:hypothetical protein